MWQCGNCQEMVDEQFDACWQCGCSRAGVLNTDFLKEPKSEEVGDEWTTRFIEQYKCSKCGHTESVVERVTGRGSGLWGAMMAKDFLAVSCQQCGFTEFYSLSILEERTGMQNFLRQLFRS